MSINPVLIWFLAGLDEHGLHPGIGRTFGEIDAAPFRALGVATASWFFLQAYHFEVGQMIGSNQRIGSCTNNHNVCVLGRRW